MVTITLIFLVSFMGWASPAPQSDLQSDPQATSQADIVLVSFTADWCPNCKILDPKLDAAMQSFDETEVARLVLDMTNAATRAQSFEKINGTVFAEVYGDHLGVTGIGILTAADSGEKIGCLTRDQSVLEIRTAILAAKQAILALPPYQRRIDGAICPVANQKVGLE